jgi:hypothetical protein
MSIGHPITIMINRTSNNQHANMMPYVHDALTSMGMGSPIDQIGMLVIGCSVALDSKWMFLFIMLVC